MALGGRELRMCARWPGGPVAHGRFTHFTAQEVGVVHTFLSNMSARATAAPKR